MVGREKRSRTLIEHPIFGDEEAASLRAGLDELYTAVAELKDRVHSQFTTIAAHAEIARQQVDLARNEARADLDRTRETLVDLIEQARRQSAGLTDHDGPGAPHDPPSSAQSERLDGFDERIGDIAELVETCFTRQRELADTMAAVIDAVFAEQRDAPVAGLSMT